MMCKILLALECAWKCDNNSNNNNSNNNNNNKKNIQE